jgi:hypothetical protein
MRATELIRSLTESDYQKTMDAIASHYKAKKVLERIRNGEGDMRIRTDLGMADKALHTMKSRLKSIILDLI